MELESGWYVRRHRVVEARTATLISVSVGDKLVTPLDFRGIE